jgi:hypothetical protein
MDRTGSTNYTRHNCVHRNACPCPCRHIWRTVQLESHCPHHHRLLLVVRCLLLSNGCWSCRMPCIEMCLHELIGLKNMGSHVLANFLRFTYLLTATRVGRLLAVGVCFNVVEHEHIWNNFALWCFNYWHYVKITIKSSIMPIRGNWLVLID